MYSPVLSVPERRVSAWVAETDPKYARAWLQSLPLANSGECAREIYQALYTVNRVTLRAQTRLDLMALYEGTVATVCGGLHSHLVHAVPPLGPKKRQLAEFIRRLHVEMAYGYKRCLRDLIQARLSLHRKSRSAVCIERALHHLSEVLLRSYLVYLPYPGEVWRETHELYRLAESMGIAEESLERAAFDGVGDVSIAARYVRTLLLGLANPYQLPHNAAQQVQAFLARWGGQAHIVRVVAPADIDTCFLIDLAADTPPVPASKSRQHLDEATRILNVRELLQTIQAFLARIDKGEAIEKLGLGLDCLDSTCVDLLQRMVRAWGETARRRYARRQQSSSIFICSGLNTLHYFANGQRPFASYVEDFPAVSRAGVPAATDAAFVELDEVENELIHNPGPEAGPAATPDMPRVDRWQLRDVGPQGMSVHRDGEAAMPVRVGDLVGVQQPSDLGRWRAAVIRWLKTPEANSVEVGVELLAAGVAPVAIRLLDRPKEQCHSMPGLRLPATEVMRRPSTLLVARGVCQVGDELELMEEETEPRRVRVLRLLERTGSFEQVVYGDIVAPKIKMRRANSK